MEKENGILPVMILLGCASILYLSASSCSDALKKTPIVVATEPSQTVPAEQTPTTRLESEPATEDSPDPHPDPHLNTIICPMCINCHSN